MTQTHLNSINSSSAFSKVYSFFFNFGYLEDSGRVLILFYVTTTAKKTGLNELKCWDCHERVYVCLCVCVCMCIGVCVSLCECIRF